MLRRKSIAAAVAFLSTAAHTALAEPPSTAPVSVDEFIKALVAQTDTFESGASNFNLPRPHPMVARLPAGSESEIAKHLGDKFTGDPQRDIYIRYHLIYPLIHPTGKPLSGNVFTELDKLLPDKIPFERREDRRYDPPEIGLKFWKLMNAASIITGFPPFQKTVWPPDSLKLMDAATRAKAEPLWAEAQALKTQFKTVDDKDAWNYNDRVGKTPWMLRQVNGDILYGMIVSGDQKMLEAVIRIIEQQAKTTPALASDSIAFVNQAYFDGWLSLYSPTALKAASTSLKRAVVAGDSAVPIKPPTKPGPVKPGAQPPPQQSAQQPRKNILSERAFTVITAMENGNVPKRPTDGALTRASTTRPAMVPRKFTAQTLDMKAVDDAIDRAVTAMEKIRPPDTDLGPSSYWAAGITAWLQQWILPGNQALASWAFLSTGENQYTPWLQKRIGWVACFQSLSTYDRAMRLRMLSMLPQKPWAPWMKRDVEWLISTMSDGGFTSGISTQATTPSVDNANSQYAVLGLAGAQAADYDIDARVWKQIDKYWRDAQFPKGNAEAGGWAVRSSKLITPGSDAFVDRASGPMSAGGVLSLSITERLLEGVKRAGVGNSTSPELSAGVQWLDTHFDINKIDGDSDLYYYLWTIQNVGQAIGYRKFNKIDWFREATATLLNQQGADGLWKGPKGPTVSTAFALLYLYRARGPLAVCKIRFGDEAAAKATAPNWNNRPNDLQNLTDDFSRRLEVPTSWQIADLDQPTNELIESVTLYLATDKPFTLSDDQINHLRDYLNAGGLLIASPEGGGTAAVLKSFRELAAKLYPDHELKKLEPTHPFFTLNQKIAEKIPVSIIDNGIRPLMVVVEKDLSRDLQIDSIGKRDAFSLLTNIYLYATGMVPKRPRMATNYIVPSGAATRATVTAARIKYDGNFDPEPQSLAQLAALLGNKHSTTLKFATAGATDLTAEQQIAFLTWSDGAQLSDADAAALRKWIDAGGTLWIDAAGGKTQASASVDVLLSKLKFQPGDAKRIADGPLFDGKTKRPGGYDVTKPSIRTFNEGDLPYVRQITVGDRPAVYVMVGDLSAGLAGVNSWGITGFSVDSARQLVVNSILNLLPAK